MRLKCYECGKVFEFWFTIAPKGYQHTDNESPRCADCLSIGLEDKQDGRTV